MTTTPPVRQRTSRNWIGLPFLLLPALLVSMDISILFVASPAITADLAPSAAQWLWMMDVYGFVMAGLLITMGGLGDRFGRKRLLLTGSILFGAASAAIMLASDPVAFIAARALLGIGAATLAPSTLSIIRGLFTAERARRLAVGAWTVAFTGGAVAGPIVGGVLLERFWWGSVFLINIPVMALLLATVPFLIPESKDPAAAGFDLPGAAISLIAIVSSVYAVKHLVEYGPDGHFAAAAIVGAVGVGLFAHRQRRAAHPLIDLSLFRIRAFTGSVAAVTAVAFAAAGIGLLAFTLLQTVHGLSPLDAALWALPTFAGTFIGAAVASVVRLSPAVGIGGGLTVVAAGFTSLGQVGPDTPLPWVIAGYSLLTLGTGVVGTLANTLVLGAAPPERAGAAAGISETGQELGAALGIAALGTVATAVFDAGFDGASDTVAGAVTEAANQPGEAADALREQAFAAYTDGFGLAALVGAAVVLACAAAAAVTLRRRGTRSL
ncbi:MFS transporter [Glycomyces salinus]|uniref:MFS transporter n=1 Tax=Glycomyces salinus TaxID=980294 RepID=UPI0018EE01FD|nr:MFS transporter [Glycomyces salinus]